MRTRGKAISVAVIADGQARDRASALAEGLRGLGFSVASLSPHDAVRARGRRTANCAITCGRLTAHLAGLLLRSRGTAWILDAAEGVADGGLQRRLLSRLARSADGVACRSEEVLATVHGSVGAAVLRAPEDDLAQLAAYVATVSRRPAATSDLRVLVLGPVNSPHVEHPALALRERGIDVQVAGDVWPGLAPSVLPGAGVAVDVMTWPTALWLRRVVRERRPDVVHAHWAPYAFHALVAGAHPLVATPWGSDVYRAEGRYRLGNVAVARRSDAVVTDSEDLVNAMVELGTPRERTMVLNWGVDLALFTPADDRVAVKRRLGLAPGPLVLSPRSLKGLYNPRVIVDAFAAVRDAVPGAQLLLKHMSPEVPPELGDLPDDVRVVGPVPYEQMADYYRAADVCVSIPDTDSSPRSVWEAMACGCPCVVSDLPWARELIEPGLDAMVVPVDAAAVAGAIGRLLTDGSFAQEMAARGRALVERHRDMRRETDRLIDLYRRLAGRPA